MLRRVSTPVRATAFALLAGLFTLSTTTPSEAQAPFSWTGMYVGVHGSYNWFDQEFPGVSPHPAGPPRMDISGAMLGGQVGAQYHFKGGILIGIEADYSRGNLSQSVRDGDFITQTGEIDWTGTLRARVGLPMGNWMPYLTAGFMWAGASYNQQCPAAATRTHCMRAGQYNVTKEETHSGLVYGGGVEFAVSQNFSIKAEALWFSLSKEIYSMGAAPLSTSGEQIGDKPIEYDGAMFRIGGNYRFN
jgi:outer membrane immunogenic protein